MIYPGARDNPGSHKQGGGARACSQHAVRPSSHVTLSVPTCMAGQSSRQSLPKWSKPVLHGLSKLLVAYLENKSPVCVKPYPCSQKSATGPCPEPVRSKHSGPFRARSCRGSDRYAGSLRLESELGQRLSWQGSTGFLSPPRQMPE
jgi:hypothetical protein